MAYTPIPTGSAGEPSPLILSVQGVAGGTNVQTVTENGALETGGNLATIATAQGVIGTGITPPAGGSGLLGYSSGIYAKLEAGLTVSFLSPPTINLGSLNGAATAVLQASTITALGSPFQAGGSISNTVFGATQSGSWSTGRTWTLSSANDSVDVIQGSSWATSITNFPATQAISAASLPLPTGAATAAGLTTINTTLGSPFQAGASIGNTVFGATQSGTWNVGLSAGTNAIGSITNTSFGISGTLPAFAATPTFNLGTLNGAATDAHLTNVQTAPGTPATTAVTIQGNASGVALPVSVAQLAPVATSALASSQQLKASSGGLSSLVVVSTTAAGFVMLFDATSVPSDGAVTPVWVYPMYAGGALNMAWSNLLKFSNGIIAVFSTTGPFTKTASATVFISGQVQ